MRQKDWRRWICIKTGEHSEVCGSARVLAEKGFSQEDISEAILKLDKRERIKQKKARRKAEQEAYVAPFRFVQEQEERWDQDRPATKAVIRGVRSITRAQYMDEQQKIRAERERIEAERERDQEQARQANEKAQADRMERESISTREHIEREFARLDAERAAKDELDRMKRAEDDARWLRKKRTQVGSLPLTVHINAGQADEGLKRLRERITREHIQRTQSPPQFVNPNITPEEANRQRFVPEVWSYIGNGERGDALSVADVGSDEWTPLRGVKSISSDVKFNMDGGQFGVPIEFMKPDPSHKITFTMFATPEMMREWDENRKGGDTMPDTGGVRLKAAPHAQRDATLAYLNGEMTGGEYVDIAILLGIDPAVALFIKNGLPYGDTRPEETQNGEG